MINEIGVIRRITSPITVEWAWENQAQGIVKWTFSNTSNSLASVVLFRSGYYFGNAFWPVYLNNSSFNTRFADSVAALTDKGTSNNSPPLMVVEFQNGKSIVAFVFTLTPGQEWSMLEGGFVQGMVPENPVTYAVSGITGKEFCIKYDQTQAADWDKQTGTNLKGYSPNPSEFQTITGILPASAAFVQLFNDVIAPGKC